MIEDAVALAWKEYAEACAEHNREHGRHACAELAHHIPLQRVEEDSGTNTASEGTHRATLPLPRV